MANKYVCFTTAPESKTIRRRQFRNVKNRTDRLIRLEIEADRSRDEIEEENKEE